MDTGGEPALLVSGVEHSFGAVVALSGVDLEVAPGECVALLGPNGAGKTTVIGLATGLLAVQVGRVGVVGGDPRRAATRRRLGVVQQQMGFPRTSTVRELVRGAAVRAGQPATAAAGALAEVGITALADRRSAALSGGQRQRVALAMALVGRPELLLLDEPTVGLDVAGRREFWQTVTARRDAGAGVLLTTHMIEEAAAVADRVVVLHAGEVVATGRPSDLTALLPDRTVSARTSLRVDEVAVLPAAVTVVADGARLRVSSTAPEELLRHWLAADPWLADLRVEGAGLEQALMTLTGVDRATVLA
jgi:ABC-2 type transport system ATP-binding protein